MRVLAAACALAFVLAAAACGGSPTSPGGGDSTQTISGSVSAYGTTSHSIEAARAGTLSVTLTWTGPADLDLYLTPIDCDGYPPDNCVILASSTASSGNSERIDWSPAASERFKVWVDNFSPTLSTSYTIVAALR
ncbi:MAG: hypothetical protein A3H96_04820 [Acidobacteria bacterium RIFCSPLOWO2_02_FULL_67_36]|nr:MAG: hypothetical protein A3H96_04820 [Acidobacteria bacterium RIFCSPLOWO2_02_FULL_67_36]OFW20074.1 MAG: hypothetical protein A3G21_07355 [Acidobacteria bacterium RIFCSPLOWO2_12_FULL_66_21]